MLGDGDTGAEADLPVHNGPCHTQPHWAGHAPLLRFGHAANHASQLERLKASLLQVDHASPLSHRALDTDKHLINKQI